MDPLSISASVVSLAGFAGKLLIGITKLSEEYNTLPQSILDSKQSIHSLQVTLGSIEDTLQSRQTPSLASERNHLEIIHHIVESCHESLLALYKELPRWDDGDGAPRRLIQSLEKTIKKDRIQEILANINQRTTVLHLSLATLSFGAQAGMRRSQEQMQQDIRSLTDKIRSLKPNRGATDASSVTLDTEAKGSLYKEINDWKKTAHEMAVTLSFKDEDGSFAPSASMDTLPTSEADDFDPEPDLSPGQSLDILKHMLKANQDLVRHFEQCGIFPMAASYQRRGIKLQKELLDRGDAPTTSPVATMKERLVDILIDSESPETDEEAKSTLKALLEEEVTRATTQTDGDRRCRLYHKLGALYLRQNNAGQARRMLDRAFQGRRAMEPPPRDLVQESATLLVKAMQLDQAHDEARGLSCWMRDKWPSEATPPATPPDDGSSLTMLYSWCNKNGMDLHSGLAFDEPDAASGRIPLHFAVEKENQEMLAAMVSHGGNVDKADPKTGSTPLHLAAFTRNKHVVGFLLEHGARVDVRDGSRMTPLHRAQSQTGGLQVAKLLLDAGPDLINKVDVYGKTALYLACEKGNEKMVRFLLDRHATVNIQGPSLYTPLLVAVEVVAQNARKISMIESLLRSGADPTLRDAQGRSAFDATNNAGLAARKVRELLCKHQQVRRPSGNRMASTAPSSNSRASS